MEDFIPLSIPNLMGNEKKYLNECLDTNFVSTAGSFVSKFEDEFAKFVGAKHSIAVMNGTAALHLSLLSAGVSSGDEVLAPNLTFIAPINAIRYCGASPIFFDSNPSNLGMNADQLEKWLQENAKLESNGRCINKNTNRAIKAILPVYIFGHFLDIERIIQIGQRYHLPVIEDASEALGSRRKNLHAGTFGMTGCFSFNGNKIATSGGGGMITTNDSNLAKRFKHLSTTAKTDDVYFIHDEVGYNYRMVNILAALGLGQLENMQHFLDIKRKNYFLYKDAFKDLKQASFYEPEEEDSSNHWFYSLIMNDSCQHTLVEVIQYFHKNRIQVRPIWKPMKELQMFHNFQAADLTFSAGLAKKTINIPCSTNLKKLEIERVINVVKELFT